MRSSTPYTCVILRGSRRGKGYNFTSTPLSVRARRDFKVDLKE